jgi:hypothetical protein
VEVEAGGMYQHLEVEVKRLLYCTVRRVSLLAHIRMREVRGLIIGQID